MLRSPRLRSATTLVSLASATLLALVAATGCNDLSPSTGALNPSACAATGSTSTTPGYGYGGAVVVACADAATVGDAGSNTLVPDAGVGGNVLIADQLNNRVLVVDRHGNVVWSFGDGSGVASDTSVVAPNDAELLPDGRVLITGTGGPPGTEPTCPGDAGCVDDRVFIVDRAGRITWQYGGHGSGFGAGALSGPASAVLVKTDAGEHVLISDQGNGRVVEVDVATGKQRWQYPRDTSSMTVAAQSAERLPDGHTLIADQGGNRVIEVASDGGIAWSYPHGDAGSLSFPAFASRLDNGNTLVADSNNLRVIEVDHSGWIVWSYPAPGVTIGASPTGAVRLANGHTLITLINEDQVIEVDHDPTPHVLYRHGRHGVAGWTGGELNQPYNAKVVGDYTGLSKPGP